MNLSEECVAKLKECEDIMLTIPASVMKLKVNSVHILLTSNAQILAGIAIFLNTGYVFFYCFYLIYCVHYYRYSGYTNIG